MKLPRDLSGTELVRHLARHWEYQIIDQRGSHIILVTETPSHHRLPVPAHKPIGIGLLRSILSEVGEVKGVDRNALLRDL